jgi:hypothetical protein
MTTPTEAAHLTGRFGYWASLSTGLMTLVSFGIAINTPPISGPFCQEGCIRYPYLDVVDRFPQDYYWMFFAIVATLCYLSFVLALQARAVLKKLVAQLGVLVATLATFTLVGDYFIQVSLIQSNLVAGETDGLSLWTQYNPSGLFIVLEELGYLLMSLSLVCVAAALPGVERLERATRWLFFGGGAANLAGLGWILLRYGNQRSYRFEVLTISINWLLLIIGAFLMVPVFRRGTSA